MKKGKEGKYTHQDKYKDIIQQEYEAQINKHDYSLQTSSDTDDYLKTSLVYH